MLTVICTLLSLARLLLVAVVVVSWFPISPGTGLARLRDLLSALVEPVLGPVRRTVPPVRLGAGALDLSPVIVLVLLTVVQVLIGC